MEFITKIKILSISFEEREGRKKEVRIEQHVVENNAGKRLS